MAVGPCFLGQCFSPRPACSPPAWGKEWRHHPTSHQHYLSPFGGNAENGRYAPFLTPATRLQKLYLQALPAVQELPALDGLPSLYALKLYELHKLSDLSALSLSHLRYFAASLIADKLSAQALADAVMAIPDLEAAALQLVDRSERRYGGVQKAFAAAGKSPLLREEISALSTWLSL